MFLHRQIHLIELKTKMGVLSKRQKIVFLELEKQGFPVLVLKSKEDIDNFLEKIA